jgi:mannose-6-phosphate isomerase
VVFEVQQNSDVTFRQYWDRVDTQTGQPRALQVEQALAYIDFPEGPVGPVAPPVAAATLRSKNLPQCEYFWSWRVRGQLPFTVREPSAPRVVLSIEGAGQVEHRRATYPVRKGDAVLLPGILGECTFQLRGQ